MSGFAVLVQPDPPAQIQDSGFQSFLQLVAEYKRLNLPAEYAAGRHCMAAKLDSPSSMHRGIVRDLATGSWLLAAGSVVNIADGASSDPNLDGLLTDYLENGMAALQRYEGHFGLVIYDGRDGSLYVISDPMGLLSVFYACQGDQTLVSTSALALASQTRSQPDALATECFLRMGTAYWNRTLWQDVKRVFPATILKITPGKVEESEYWAPTIDERVARLPFDEAVVEAADLLSRTFKRALQREGKIWTDLTGGFDTRLAVMLMANLGIPFIVCCVGPEGHPDVQISRLICQEMGWEYWHMPLPDSWEHEQCAWLQTAVHKGDARLSAIPLAGVLWGHQERSARSMAHFIGVGGEQWRDSAGYLSGNLLNLGRSPQVNYDFLVNSKLLRRIPVSAMRTDRTQEVRQELREYLQRLRSRYAELPNTVQLEFIFIRHRHPTFGGAYLSAASGIERSLMPFCFRQPTDFAFSLNYRWKLPHHCRFQRSLMEQQNPRLARMMSTAGGPAIPIRLTNVHRFGPLWTKAISAAMSRLSNTLLGKPITIWSQTSGHTEYPPLAWRRSWLHFAAAEGLLKPSEMYSGTLYDTARLQALVSQADRSDFQHEAFLGRVITVELAMRAVGTSVQ